MIAMAGKADVRAACERCGAGFVSRGYARFCATCRPEVKRFKKTKYAITEQVRALLTGERGYDTRIRGRTAELAEQLGWPGWAVKKVAKRLGLTRPWPADRRPWTQAEIRVLRAWCGRRTAKWIGAKLGRGETSVVLKMKRLRLSQRITEGYTVADLARCFGIDHHGVDRWIERGWLGRRWVGQTSGKSMIDEAEVLRFVRERREEYRLDKVDQAWLLWLVFDSNAATTNQNGQETTPIPPPHTVARRAAEVRRVKGADKGMGTGE